MNFKPSASARREIGPFQPAPARLPRREFGRWHGEEIVPCTPPVTAAVQKGAQKEAASAQLVEHGAVFDESHPKKVKIIGYRFWVNYTGNFRRWWRTRKALKKTLDIAGKIAAGVQRIMSNSREIIAGKHKIEKALLDNARLIQPHEQHDQLKPSPKYTGYKHKEAA
jgi:hypothetical protein